MSKEIRKTTQKTEKYVHFAASGIERIEISLKSTNLGIRNAEEAQRVKEQQDALVAKGIILPNSVVIPLANFVMLDSQRRHEPWRLNGCIRAISKLGISRSAAHDRKTLGNGFLTGQKLWNGLSWKPPASFYGVMELVCKQT